MGLYKQEGSSNWSYRFQFRGKDIRESAGTSNRQAAEQAEAKRKRELWEQDRLGVKISKSWGEAVAAYVPTLVEGRGKEEAKRELKWISTHLAGPLSKIDLDRLQALQAAKAASITARTGKPAAPGTINKVLGIVMAVLHNAVRLKWIDHVPQLGQIPDTAKVIVFITREQATKLLAELPLHQFHMVVFALETGLRRSNVTQLKWAQVDLARRIAWVNPDEAKEGQGIPVPLSTAAVALLKLVEHDDKTFCFVYRGAPVKQTSTKAWKLAKARAGIKFRFRWHDLRHTWASWHRQDGTPVAVLKELGAWKDDRMPGRYAHLGADHLAEFVDKRVGIKPGIAPTRTVKKKSVSS